MLGHSTANNPVIVGSSVHNIRIERLWRDTFRCVLSVFHQLFNFLEHGEQLDPLSERDLFCLHFVYIPRINNALKAFQSGWNNHALTTECSRTPLQLYTAGNLLRGNRQDGTHAGDSISSLPDSAGVDVPEMNFSLTQHQLDSLKSIVNPLQDSSNYGIELYEAAQLFVSNI